MSRYRASASGLSAGESRVTLFAVLVVVAILYVSAYALRVTTYGGEPSALVGFGCAAGAPCWPDRNPKLMPPRFVQFATGGYDGQFFFLLAAEAGSGQRAVLDSAEFRRARIGLPWMLAWVRPLLGSGALVHAFPILLLMLHLLSVAICARQVGTGSLLLYGLNPFSLLSFWLSTADGAALALAVLGICMRRSSSTGLRLGAVPVLALALLTKETVLALLLAGAAEEVLARFRLRALLAWVLVGVPTALWWSHVGFSPGMAAERGGPFLGGILGYLAQPDAPLSPRTVLLALLSGWLVACIVLILYSRGRWSSDSRIRSPLIVVGAVLVLTGLATAEYWSNFANIGRLATALAGIWALWELPRLPGRGAGLALGLPAILALLLLGAQLRYEARGLERPLPYRLRTMHTSHADGPAPARAAQSRSRRLLRSASLVR